MSVLLMASATMYATTNVGIEARASVTVELIGSSALGNRTALIKPLLLMIDREPSIVDF